MKIPKGYRRLRLGEIYPNQFYCNLHILKLTEPFIIINNNIWYVGQLMDCFRLRLPREIHSMCFHIVKK